MVVDFSKELLIKHLVTLGLIEVVDAGLPSSSQLTRHLVTLIKLKELVDAGLPSSSIIIESPSHDNYQQPSDSLQIVISGDPESRKEEEGPTSAVPEWMITVEQKFELAKKDDATWKKLCIYKVPQYLRAGEDKAYIPNFVSLGPYHHGKKHLRPMERHKWRAFYHVLKRGNQDAKLYHDSIKGVEKKARAYYEGQIGMSSDQFVQMMILDGCFVLEQFRGAAEGFMKRGYSKWDPVFAMKGSMFSIQRDMLMLENQIPFFILDRLLGLQSNQSDVAELALQFFDALIPTNEPWTKREPSRRNSIPFDPLSGNQDHLHCLQVFRMNLLMEGPTMDPRGQNKKWSDKRRTPFIHCVTELREAGIKFKRGKTRNFWDIKFNKGVFKIPRLVIHDGTKSLFLNLIAFEQSHSGCRSHITSYAFFMDNLINSQEDVSYLHDHGILEHRLGNDADVADLFNRLCRDIDFDISNSYLSDIPPKVDRFYNRRCNKWRATLKHKYFTNPWAISSLVAAVILLILTFMQTFYGVYGYYRPLS